MDVLDLVVALGSPSTRTEAARKLAARCGAEELVVLVKDVEVGALIPASGFDQTLSGGPTWRQLLRCCLLPGVYVQQVELPRGSERRALCLAADAVTIAFIGGDPDVALVESVSRVMPLLCRAFAAEQQARFSDAVAKDALATAQRAQALADALEAARAEHARLNGRLHEEHERKDHFLAMLAHELRNPLTPLVTCIELIRRGQGMATEKQLDVMTRQTRQLTRLVEDLLDVSRVSRGRIELRRDRLRLSDVVRDALEASRPFLDSRCHRVEVLSSDDRIELEADYVRIGQVLANLLHNAGKYTDMGGTIGIAWGQGPEGAYVSVQDNGIGIDANMRESIFDMFTQAPMSLARAQGGLGIGLTLVRALVKLHGGRVEVRSDGPGRGSVFTVHLPMTSAAPAAAPAAPGIAAAEAEQRPMRILVVDDNEDAANAMAELLRSMGHHAEVAYSGLTATHVAEDVDPDLVLLDIGLPEIDGYEVARRLRRNNRRRVRLVAVTGYGAATDKRLASEAGFDAHVVKPVMPETLAALIQQAQLHA